MKNEINIYVHGSCKFTEYQEGFGSVGTGGYGVVITSNGKMLKELSGGFHNTTNARMDIVGITLALKEINTTSRIKLYNPNQYVIDTLTKGWLKRWITEGFKKRKHSDLWVELHGLLETFDYPITFLPVESVERTLEYKKAVQLSRSFYDRLKPPNDLQG